ncbi:MAG TPA: S41 family peptidase [Allosphingosinicella sp.]|jgi:C-terminal processing protease CtpA/Prc|nr:S41 family peptidase [Allosphingosinicella sp.]
MKAVLPLLLLAGAPASTQAAPAPSTSAAMSPADARVADLVRVWYSARLFDPDLAGPKDDWDAALVAAVPAARAAPDDAAFAGVVSAMLRPIGGYVIPLQPPPGTAPPAVPAQPAAAPAPPPAFRIENGAAVASCVGIGRLSGAAAQKDAFAAVAAAASAHGLVIDCRQVPYDNARYVFTQTLKAWVESVAGTEIARTLPNGGLRMRFHEGYPSEGSAGSGGYVQGNSVAELPPIRAAKALGSAAGVPRLVLLADQNMPDPWELAGGLQAAGLARVVAEGPLPEGMLYPLKQPHVFAVIPVSEYVYPNGSIGFRPDACVPYGQDEQALHVALTMLDPAARGPVCPDQRPAASPAPAPPSDIASDRAPAVGERVLALAKLWGAIDYFYPYKSLLERPWEGQLEAFLPAFLAADSRTAYEDAVQGLAHQIEDSHVHVEGLRESWMGRRGWTPPVAIRPVGGGFAIVSVYPDLAGRIRPGDEIVAVDGQPAAAIAAHIGRTISASTPQALAGFTAWMLAAGPQGSDARLTLRRAGAPPFDVTVKRSLPVASAAGRPGDGKPAWRRLAPDIGYVDLQRLTFADANKALDDLLDTRAIIFDLRGYPQGTAWTIAPRLALPGRDGAVAALFRRPHYYMPSGPTEMFTSFDQRLPPTDKLHYKGRVIVLIDDRAISQSEYTAMFFKAAADPVFVGTPTTGANGDVTVIALPGGLSVSFTGHDVRFPNGRQLQRVGIQPDVKVAPTLAGIRAGRDEVLEAGIRLARTHEFEFGTFRLSAPAAPAPPCGTRPPTGATGRRRRC